MPPRGRSPAGDAHAPPYPVSSPRMHSPLVSAIVLFHNSRSAEEAKNCIEALKNQTIADQLEIIAVNNGADKNVHKIIESATQDAENLQLIRSEKNLGYGAGNNFGAKHATGEFILIINPDNRLEPNAAEVMVRFLQKNPDIGVVGPQLIFPDGTIRDSYRTFPSPLDIIIKRTPLKKIFKNRIRRYLQWDRDSNEIGDVDWLCGACLLIKRSLFEEFGGFDERYFLFFEDCDLCRKVWGKNLRVTYLPTAKARDSEQRLSSGGVFSVFTKKTVRVHVASAVKYFWKWSKSTKFQASSTKRISNSKSQRVL